MAKQGLYRVVALSKEVWRVAGKRTYTQMQVFGPASFNECFEFQQQHLNGYAGWHQPTIKNVRAAPKVKKEPAKPKKYKRLNVQCEEGLYKRIIELKNPDSFINTALKNAFKRKDNYKPKK